MAKPHLLQVLCGPARHAIVALAYDPASEGIRGTEDAIRAVLSQIDELIAARRIDPWCGICHAPRSAWTERGASSSRCCARESSTGSANRKAGGGASRSNATTVLIRRSMPLS